MPELRRLGHAGRHAPPAPPSGKAHRKTGRLLWRAPAGGPVASSPLLEGGAVYVGVNHPRKGALLALDAATGRERWRRQADQAIKSSPALGDGRLLVGTYAGDLLAVRVRYFVVQTQVPFQRGPGVFSRQ